MSRFGWSYPPGAANDPFAPYNQTEDWSMDCEEIETVLRNHDTGRWDWEKITCCLTGKDADLEPWGDQGIELGSCDEDGVNFTVHGYKTFAGDDVCMNTTPEQDEDEGFWEKARGAFLDQAQEVVCGCNSAGEWTGDDWGMTFEEDGFVNWVLKDDDTTVDYEETALAVIKKAEEMLSPWEEEMRLADDIMSALAGWHTWDKDKGEYVKCQPGKPGPEAVWNFLNEETNDE